MNRIIIIGGGSFGTALAQQLSGNKENDITIIVKRDEVERYINEERVNTIFFPGKRLNDNINATKNYALLKEADVVLLAIPSQSIVEIIPVLLENMNKNTLLLNMAKGVMEDGSTIFSFLKNKLPGYQIATLKGASFSAEMINHSPTLFTLGYEDYRHLKRVKKIIQHTNLFIDFTSDIRGVEFLSALKNIYAILVGHVDAVYNAANTRFMVLTKAIGEIKLILNHLGGRSDSLLLSCGIGDISLTSLNDLSRNRTLGLFIGKGFMTNEDINNSVVLEGVKTLRFLDSVIDYPLRGKLPLFNELVDLLVKKNKTKLELDFHRLMQAEFTTILTYGTFDMIHYGHIELLRRAKSMGDRLVVGLATDDLNRRKGKHFEMDYETRKRYLESIQYVDMVFPQDSDEQKLEDVQNHQVDILVMNDKYTGQYDYLKEYCNVEYIPRVKGF